MFLAILGQTQRLREVAGLAAHPDGRLGVELAALILGLQIGSVRCHTLHHSLVYEPAKILLSNTSFASNFESNLYLNRYHHLHLLWHHVLLH